MEVKFKYKTYLDVNYKNLYEVLCDNLRSKKNYTLNFDNDLTLIIRNLKCLSLMPKALDCETFESIEPILIIDEKETRKIPHNFKILIISENE